MTFVFPYRRGRDDFDIQQSIRFIRMSFPEANIVTVGDKVATIDNIPCPQLNNIRGSDVTNKMLTFARERGGSFIYMNDDFYITPKLRADIPIHVGEFELNPRHPSHYREAMFNTIEFLKYYDRPLWNFETHSPVLMDSDKLLEIFELIEWQRYNHFIKSIYLNMNLPEFIRKGDNVKLAKDNIPKAEELLRTYGCFSTSDSFLTTRGRSWLKNLFWIPEV
jgi:hypothetical protein